MKGKRNALIVGLMMSLTLMLSCSKKQIARPPGVELTVSKTKMLPGESSLITLNGSEPSNFGSLTSMKIFIERPGQSDSLLCEWKRDSTDKPVYTAHLEYILTTHVVKSTVYEIKCVLTNLDEAVTTARSTITVEVGRIYEPINIFSLIPDKNTTRCLSILTQKVYKLDTAYHNFVDLVYYYGKGPPGVYCLASPDYTNLASESSYDLTQWKNIHKRNTIIVLAGISKSLFTSIKNYGELEKAWVTPHNKAVFDMTSDKAFCILTEEGKKGIMYITSRSTDKLYLDIKMEK